MRHGRVVLIFYPDARPPRNRFASFLAVEARLRPHHMPMTPLLSCIPVCLTFVSIAIIGLIVVVFGLSNRVPTDDPPEGASEAPTEAAGRPPLWVFPLVLLAAILLLLAMSQVWTD